MPESAGSWSAICRHPETIHPLLQLIRAGLLDAAGLVAQLLEALADPAAFFRWQRAQLFIALPDASPLVGRQFPEFLAALQDLRALLRVELLASGRAGRARPRAPQASSPASVARHATAFRAAPRAACPSGRARFPARTVAPASVRSTGRRGNAALPQASSNAAAISARRASGCSFLRSSFLFPGSCAVGGAFAGGFTTSSMRLASSSDQSPRNSIRSAGGGAGLALGGGAVACAAAMTSSSSTAAPGIRQPLVHVQVLVELGIDIVGQQFKCVCRCRHDRLRRAQHQHHRKHRGRSQAAGGHPPARMPGCVASPTARGARAPRASPA